MRLRIFLLGMFFMMLVAAPGLADLAIKAQVSKTALTADEVINYKVTIALSKERLPEPKFPEFKGFSVLSSVQSSSVSFAGKEISTTLGYEFILAPLDTGKFKIEPCQLSIAGRIYASEAFEIEVKPAKTPLPQKPPQPPRIQPEPEEPRITL